MNQADAAFIDWLAAQMVPPERDELDGGIVDVSADDFKAGRTRILHQYRLPKGNKDCRSFPSGHVMIFDLWHAARIYRWNGADLATTGSTLAALTRALRSAYPAAGMNPVPFALAAGGVLQWGGVAAHNAPRIQGDPAGLLSSCAAVAALSGSPFNAAAAVPADVWMNSGFTKIYALQFNRFIMYDSRVAAAFELLVLIHRRQHNIRRVPPIANSLCSVPGRAAKRTVGALRAKTSSQDHLKANLAGNWLIDQVFARHPVLAAKWDRHTRGIDRFRAIEAALFMLGYDIGSNPASTTGP